VVDAFGERGFFAVTTCRSQIFSVPLRPDTNAIVLASGEIAGDRSRPE
jgi:hypothetical protein